MKKSKPQSEVRKIKDGFVPIPNEVLDALSTCRLNGGSLNIIAHILRKTYGWHEESCSGSLGIIAAETGRHRTRIGTDLADLMERKIVVEVVPPTFRRPRQIAINPRTHEWQYNPLEATGGQRECGQSAKPLTVSETADGVSANPLQGQSADPLTPLSQTYLQTPSLQTGGGVTPMKPASSAPKKPASAVSREPDGRVRELMRYFGDLHLEHRGSAYVAAFGADGAALKRVLSKLSEDDVRYRMGRYFTRRDRWNETNGYSVRNFCSVINGLQGQPVRGLSAFKLSEIEAAQKQGVA